MLPILALIALASPTSIGDFQMPMGGPRSVIDKTLLPPKIPDCRTDAEIRWALEEKAQGLPQSCDPPKSLRKIRRLDEKH